MVFINIIFLMFQGSIHYTALHLVPIMSPKATPKTVTITHTFLGFGDLENLEEYWSRILNNVP
jgi:hypothetical protein